MARLGKEEEYFLAREAQQRAQFRKQLEQQAMDAAERRKVASEVGVDDEDIVDRIRALGFDGENAGLLHLIPLIEVAWADGSMSKKEREVLLGAAETHGIKPGTKAATFLASLLEERPSDTVLHELLDVLRDVLHAKNLHPVNLVEACMEVAEASGGFLGIRNPVSGEERDLIDQIAGILGTDAKKEITDKLA